MAAENQILEQLARIEFKVDVLFRALKLSPMERMMPGNLHNCPFCETQVKYSIDPVENVVKTKCNCTTGMFVVNMKMFEPEKYKPTEDELKKLLEKEKADD